MDNSDYSKYKKYKHKYCLLKKILLIKNQITITLGNMHLFIEESYHNKQILLHYALLYKHDDIITLLSK